MFSDTRQKRSFKFHLQYHHRKGAATARHERSRLYVLSSLVLYSSELPFFRLWCEFLIFTLTPVHFPHRRLVVCYFSSFLLSLESSTGARLFSKMKEFSYLDSVFTFIEEGLAVECLMRHLLSSSVKSCDDEGKSYSTELWSTIKLRSMRLHNLLVLYHTLKAQVYS